MALDTRDQGVLLTMGEAFSRKGNLDRFWQTVADNHYPERASFTRPLDLGEEALKDRFGYQLEGVIDASLLEPESIPLVRYKRCGASWWKFW